MKNLYRLTLAGFMFFFAAVLLAIVDFRRGFLFAEYIRSPYTAFNPAQLLLIATGAIGMFVCGRLLKRFDPRGASSPHYATAFTFGCLGLLVIDLFIYRGVPAARAIASGTLSADWLKAFDSTGWLRPLALSTSYLLTVWHATVLGILIAGLALTVLPPYLKSFFSRSGILGTIAGALYAIPQPFCSCCAAVTVPSYARRGASTDFALSFVVGSPMLNITTIILAFTLLPLRFAILRAAAGVILPTVVTYAVARVAERWQKPALIVPMDRDRAVRWVDRYIQIFNVDALIEDRRLDKPGSILTAWLRASGKLALILIPTLFIWSVITGIIIQLLPPAFGNNFFSVVLAAIGGTILMISTWTEIPVALQLIHSGFTGPAATALVVLPPLSLPCVMLLGGAIRRFGSVALLMLAVVISGIAAGMIFL